MPSVRTIQLDDALFRTDAPNGLVVVTERLPGVRSAAAGIWVRSASGHEARAKMGVSHLLEHMVFKGTERRTARDIAVSLEARGGSLDAYTSRDTTSFQAHVLDADLPLALDVLTDLVRRPLLRQSDLDLERNVVLEELHGVQDTPDDLVFELWGETLWPEHPYGASRFSGRLRRWGAGDDRPSESCTRGTTTRATASSPSPVTSNTNRFSISGRPRLV